MSNPLRFAIGFLVGIAIGMICRGATLLASGDLPHAAAAMISGCLMLGVAAMVIIP